MSNLTSDIEIPEKHTTDLNLGSIQIFCTGGEGGAGGEYFILSLQLLHACHLQYILSTVFAMPCMLLHGGCHAHPKKLFVSANRTFSTSPPMLPPPPPQPSIQNYYWLGCALPRESFIICAYFKKDAMFFLEKPDFFCEGVIYTAERMLLVYAVCII